MKKDEIIEQLAPYYKARQDQNGLKPSPLSKVKLKELNSKLKHFISKNKTKSLPTPRAQWGDDSTISLLGLRFLNTNIDMKPIITYFWDLNPRAS
jgi:hypothetical protein